VIGGRLSAFGSNARLGRGPWMVAEADESDGSFLKLTPVIGIITNVDREHLDHYGTFDAVGDAFVTFANGVPFYGAVMACADDAPLRALFPRCTRRVVTYGIASEEAELRAVDVRLEAFASTCTVQQRTRGGATHTLGDLRLAVPGRHNVLNALAAVAVGLELAIPYETIASALAEFRGAERRFQVVGVEGGVTVVDDYGHHPSEIAAVVDAARACRPTRLVLVFQPHRYTRTQHLMAEFARVLAHADVVVLTDIYAAGEDPIAGVSVEALAESLLAETRNPVHIVRPLDAIAGAVAALARPGDFVVTLGAGSIGSVGERIVVALRAANEVKA
jgi:UDP-N-acetylmuramate--alanine ligase